MTLYFSRHWRSLCGLTTFTYTQFTVADSLPGFELSIWVVEAGPVGLATARFLELPAWIPLRVWMFVSCVCYVGSGLCDELITCSGSLGCVGSRNLNMRRPRADLGCCATESSELYKCVRCDILLVSQPQYHMKAYVASKKRPAYSCCGYYILWCPVSPFIALRFRMALIDSYLFTDRVTKCMFCFRVLFC